MHLAEQLAFLDASASAYDKGNGSEAKRIASTIRLLVHDGRPPSRSQSLLTHLGVKDRLPWTDTAAGQIREAALSIGSGLAMTEMSLDGSGTSRFVPFLGVLPPERIHPGAAFVDWWNDPVLTDADGVDHSRRSLVLRVANKDGGAHVDSKLPRDYAAISRENSIGIAQAETPEEPNSAAIAFGVAYNDSGLARARVDGPALENSPVLANVRQVAWELRDTLRRHLVIAGPRPFVRTPICPLSIHETPKRAAGGLCPCGNGRPFERCFGLRQPRRSFSINDLAD